MKAQSLVSLKKALSQRTDVDVLEICLKLIKLKKENKELLTYLLFYDDEQLFIDDVKESIDEQFALMNTSHGYYIRKSTRKILNTTKRFIRYSKNKQTEIELLLYFLERLYTLKPRHLNNTRMQNMMAQTIKTIEKAIDTLHPDLQYDYHKLLQESAAR